MKYNRIRHFGDNFKYEEVYQRCFTRKDHFELFSFCAAKTFLGLWWYPNKPCMDG